MHDDRYDEDYSDPRQRCQHGTFIGSWWGPDYLCGWCEDGVSRSEQLAALRAQARYRQTREVREALEWWVAIRKVASRVEDPAVIAEALATAKARYRDALAVLTAAH